jgi:tRNA(fMet)-specific endonuclease VapC
MKTLKTFFRRLRVQGIRIGTHDLRMATIALSRGATLVTRKVRDFAMIPSLNIEGWSLAREDVTTGE